MLFLFKLGDFIFQFFISTVEKLILMLHDTEQVVHGIKIFQLGHGDLFNVGFGVFIHKSMLECLKKTFKYLYYALKALQR